MTIEILSLVLVLSMAASTVSYDYAELQLALQWPPSYCYSTTQWIQCKHIPLEFKVHGLWPYPPDSNRFFKCNPGIKPDYQKMSGNTLEGMDIHWPNLNIRTNRRFLWDHEYEYHGHCFTRFHNSEAYFQTGLYIATEVIRDSMHIITMRLRSGQSENGGLYHIPDFKEVTTNGRKIIIGLRCNYAVNDRIPQLLEIVFCTDANMNLKNCNFVDYCYKLKSGQPNVNGLFRIPQVLGS